jgi:hypothetical protein
MANRRQNGIVDMVNYHNAIIDTAPGAGGYWSSPVSSRDNRLDRMHFSIRGTWAGTVTLQFKRPEDATWTDYDEYTENTREIIEDSSNTLWRIGVANGDYTSGTIIAGIDFSRINE